MFFGEGQGDWRISESDIRHGPSHIFNLTVWPGEFVAIVGESGSGKSTLMNIIGVLDKPTSGEYTLDGVDIHKADDDELAGIESIVLCAIGGCNLVRRTEKGRLRRRGWGLRWEKAQKGGKGTNLRGFFED